MRVIAFYLPQFHRTPQNDAWWGEGFTEWVNMKKAQPLYPGHYQPRIPQGGNYYDLTDDSVKAWQVQLAKDHGVYGFCFYHYWFNDGDLLLEKPVEQYLANRDLDLPFCLCWANEPWTMAWVSRQDRVLMGQDYGREATWRRHFDYLLPYFRDPRYIREDGCPLFVIYRPEQIPCLNEMLDYWQALAVENGLKGLKFAYQHIEFDRQGGDDSRFAFNIEYEPGYGESHLSAGGHQALKTVAKKLDSVANALTGHQLSELYLRKVRRLSYDQVWQSILSHDPPDKKRIAGAFVDWDNTPRRGTKGLVVEGATPEKFYRYMKEKIAQTKRCYSTDMIFLFAWNEWAEGGYMEPDEKYGLGYLEALKRALDEAEHED